LRKGGQLCHEPADPVASSQWVVYGVDRTRLFELNFGADLRPCWTLPELGPGIYIVRITSKGGFGTRTSVHKVMVVP
jgi:hypothetical protein